MADRWTLVTPDGDYHLNASFSAPQLHAGGVDANAALRRDGRRAYQRSGGGLMTPGPHVLHGRVWRDDLDIQALVYELNDIRDAVAASTQLRRENDAGSYTYRDLAGGPTPEVTPDSLGGWEVQIELWPGRPSPTFIPLRPASHLYIYYDTSGSVGADDLNSIRAAMDQVIVDLHAGGVPLENIHEIDSTTERYLTWFAQSHDDYVVVAILNEASPHYHGETSDGGPTTDWLAGYEALVSHLATVTRFRAIIYGLDPATGTQPEQVLQATTFNTQHVPRAVPGTEGYASSPSLAELGVSYRTEVESGQTAEAYLDDLWTLLGG